MMRDSKIIGRRTRRPSPEAYLGLLGPHPALQPLDQRADAGLADDAAAFRRLAVEFTLDGEDLVDALHRLNGHRRPHGLAEIGQLEELGTAVGPA